MSAQNLPAPSGGVTSPSLVAKAVERLSDAGLSLAINGTYPQ